MIKLTIRNTTLFLILFTCYNIYGQQAGSFEKIKIRGNVSVSYHITQNNDNKIIVGENNQLVKYKISNNTLILRNKKQRIKKGQKVNVNIYGLPLKEIIVRNFAFISIEDQMHTDTLGIKIVSGGELRLNLKSNYLKSIVRTGGFAYLEGEINTISLKVSTGAKFRANEANIAEAHIRLNTGGFAAFNNKTKISGKTNTGSELKVYGKADVSKIKKSTRGIINFESDDK